MNTSGFPTRPTGAASERERLARASILVLGDATLERALDGERDDTDGPQARPTTLRLRAERAEPGAGAAVVGALARLGVASAFICVLGDDLAGAQLTQLIGEQRNVEPWLLIDSAKSTVTETRYRIAGETVFRTVREDIVDTPPALRTRMIRIAVETLSLTAVALLTDRDHGTLDAETAAEIIAASRQAGRLVVADVGRTGPRHGRYAGVDALLAHAGRRKDAEAAAHALRAREAARAIVLFGDDGAITVADTDGTVSVPCTEPDCSDVAYAERVALFASGLATGRTVRDAAELTGRLAGVG